jgi:hypothetical protein
MSSWVGGREQVHVVVERGGRGKRRRVKVRQAVLDKDMIVPAKEGSESGSVNWPPSPRARP